jgi:uncharacterized protein YndB with AHSA1/START domain
MPSPTDRDGTMEISGGRPVIRFERRLAHPIERVWAALTEPDEIVGWLAEAEVDLVEGGRIRLRWLNSDDEGNQAEMTATITRLDPPRLIEYEGDLHGLLRWELRPDGDGCVLTFTNETGAPPAMRSKVLAGWHIHLDHLEEALDGRPVDWPRWSEEHRPRWGEIERRYAVASAGSDSSPSPAR